MKNLKFAVMQNFKKIRINTKKKKEDGVIHNLLEQRKLADDISRNQIEDQLANKNFEKNRQMIIDQVGGMVDNGCNLSRIKMWKVKQRVCPKQDVAYPVAKINKDGQMVSGKKELTKLFEELFDKHLAFT